MSQFLGQILTLLTTSPGNLVYHIVLVFSIAGALQGAIHQARTSGFPQAKRTVFGLGVLLALQLFLFLMSGLVWQGLVNGQVLLPPLDRLITLLSLLWIIWLWAFPEPIRMADAAVVLLNLLAIVAFGATVALWGLRPAAGFNTSFFETAWQLFSLVVILLGGVWLAARRPNGWSNGLAMLVLGFIGHLLSLLFRGEGNFPGFVRLFQLALFPILLTLTQRFAEVPAPEKAEVTRPRGANEPFKERRRYSTDPKTFHSLMSLAAETDPNKIAQALTRGIAQAMLADLCFLVANGTDKNLTISCGYDLIREEALGGANLTREDVPLLANALLRGRPLRLPASSTSTDLKGLGKVLALSNPGHLLSVPIVGNDHKPLGGILILSPYSNRLWSSDDQAYLSNVAPLFLPVLERGQRMGALQEERERYVQSAHEANLQTAQARDEQKKLETELEDLRVKLAEASQHTEKLGAVMAMQEEAQMLAEKLRTENEQLRNAQGGTGGGEQMERELRQSLEDVAHMQNELAQANMKIMELEKRPESPITGDQVEVIASISQELRQPMSSIIGYTDLLMGESVGILGALQRKFIERIKASTERIGGLVDDLIQITNLDTGKLEFKSEPIDLNLIIDNAMAYTSTQIREKNITLRLDLTETAPRITTDRDALQQILIHLLQNATSATHAEGNITLRVHLENQDGNDFLSIQVTDSGGGIDPQDLPRVFARRYRAEHSLIQGVGDTGVGLSIAKTLVEAQHGRIWVETEAGVGSTFSLLMPVVVESTGESK